MALAYDATSNGTAATSTITVAHTCTGTNLILIVTVCQQGSPNVPTCTYNGVSMTKLPQQVYTNGRNDVFYLGNPTTGAHNIVASASGANAMSLAAASYTGVGNFTPESSNGGVDDTTGATSLTGVITTVADNCWAILGAGTQVNGQTAGTGANQRSTGAQLNCTAGIYDNNAAKHPAGSVSEQVTFSAARYAYTILSIKPTNLQTVTETVAMTEGSKWGYVVGETVSSKEVFLKTIAETISTTEGTPRFHLAPKNVSKNTSTWNNVTKN